MILDLYQALLRIESGSKYHTPAQVLAALPCAEGKTQPVSYYASKYLCGKDFATMINARDFKGDIYDPEYCTPSQRKEMEELARHRDALREDKLETTTMSAPAATYITVLGMEAEFVPLDVLIHRAWNGTQGQESEE